MEAWISEKQQLLIVPHLGDNKHDAFETDISVHGDRCTDICEAGQKLIYDRNHHTDSIAQRCEQLCNKIYNLGELANIRKFNLLDNSTYLQFMWKADVMEYWIADKEARSFTIVITRREENEMENDKLRKEFARHANAFYSWLTETRGMMMEGSGLLEGFWIQTLLSLLLAAAEFDTVKFWFAQVQCLIYCDAN
jgi:hypothetical protein